MKIMFAAGDVGGARALLPVMRQAANVDLDIFALDHGVLREEGEVAWNWLDLDVACTTKPDALIYATSVVDLPAFQCACAMKDLGVPVIHVLDNWSNYASRLYGTDRNGSERCLIPDVYAVMDEISLQHAISDGVPKSILQVTGHPDLAKLSNERAYHGIPSTDAINILFVSEPARKDSGSAENSLGRGYDEVLVSTMFADALSNYLATRSGSQVVNLRVAPHPREDFNEIALRWSELVSQISARAGQDINFGVVERGFTRIALHEATHIVGMSSILLYEAWLLERPVLSIQPRLRWPNMFVIGQREGVRLCTSKSSLAIDVEAWMIDRYPVGSGKTNLVLHVDAAEKILHTTEALVKLTLHADSR